jgi:hypothetical protein
MAAIDEDLAQRVRESLFNLADFADISECKMFGSLVFMVNGHMACGVGVGVGVGDEGLVLRVGADRYEQALTQPHAKEMDFTGRPMKGFLYITWEGIEADEDLSSWLDLSLGFLLAQPPK